MKYSYRDVLNIQKKIERDNEEGHVLNERQLILKLLDIVIEQQARIQTLELEVLM